MQGLIINGCAIKLDKILDKEQLPKTAEGDKGEAERTSQKVLWFNFHVLFELI